MKENGKHWWYVLLIGLTFSIALGGIAYAAFGGRSLSRGSRGADVVDLQTKLVQLGYNLGRVDGVFGPKTETALKNFQKDHGLKVDGLAGTSAIKELDNLTKQSTNSSGKAIGNKNININLLAHVVSAEARGEPFLGQVAVAAVILNRLADPAFPKTIANIIYQPGAFSSVSDGQINLPPTASSIRAAQVAVSGSDPSKGALFFFNPAKTSNKYIWSRPEITKIGHQIFTK